MLVEHEYLIGTAFQLEKIGSGKERIVLFLFLAFSRCSHQSTKLLVLGVFNLSC